MLHVALHARINDTLPKWAEHIKIHDHHQTYHVTNMLVILYGQPQQLLSHISMFVLIILSNLTKNKQLTQNSQYITHMHKHTDPFT